MLWRSTLNITIKLVGSLNFLIILTLKQVVKILSWTQGVVESSEHHADYMFMYNLREDVWTSLFFAVSQ